MPADPFIPAAQYVRMSTEHQQYSLHNQQIAIQAYASEHGFSIVRTYTDGAKSGVVLKYREGLRQLLQDVMNGNCGYRAILVYDISRWGRFQDADEAAHYEFLCKSTGVPIHYCAEIFVNDGALPNMLMKALKRTMAGEYSRELGVKVLAGLRRLAQLGFKQGGCPGYGLRRMLVSAAGEPKMLLAYGERKSITTDRVILVPGPAGEVECIREIYRMFIDEKRTVHAIARELNRRNIKYLRTTKWDHTAVHTILSHPKYAGCNRFGRTSKRLGAAAVRIPQAEWILARGAFLPVVDDATFQAAQHLLLGRTINRSNDELLVALRSLLDRNGRLSNALIKEAPEMPSPSVYRHRFGSVRRAFELIGYGKPEDFGRVDIRRRTQAMHEHLVDKIQATYPTEVSIVRRGGRWRPLVRLRSGLVISVLLSRSIGAKGRCPRWQVNPVAHERQHTTLLVLLNSDNDAFEEMYILPYMDRQRRFHITGDNVWLKRGEQLRDVADFRQAVEIIVKTRSLNRDSHESLTRGIARPPISE
jgi:DNA invertase Pin-like site-specific DNA recombinase